MRRNDREITDPKRVLEIVDACQCCRLGLCDQGEAYIVPLSFGYTEADGKYTFYFHSAPEGRKLDLLRRNGRASFEMDAGYRLHTADKACGYSAAFQCVMGSGTVTFLEDPAEKRRGLALLMEHSTGLADWDFPDSAVNATCVFRLEVQALSCKEHL